MKQLGFVSPPSPPEEPEEKRKHPEAECCRLYPFLSFLGRKLGVLSYSKLLPGLQGQEIGESRASRFFLKKLICEEKMKIEKRKTKESRPVEERFPKYILDRQKKGI